jgi:Double zinc ribbon
MIPLLLGSVLAVLALAYVLYPLLKGNIAAPVVILAPEAAPEASALDALREIEFDEATGKLSPEDYATLKATYTPLALAELRARESGESTPSAAASSDAAEALIARAKQRGGSCPSCGPRPESDALFCSDCGRFLGAVCLSCGAPAGSDSARFCVECGAALAA